ncbi:MAG TPA: nuclear transport factor 2 family protein [Rudaea sp.]|nr:nuclear transport factor 2 family protein [Rudaea sp.]
MNGALKQLAAVMLFANATSAVALDDKAAVAALDTAYQAAVKNNDVAAMDKILADDFVLVTSSGKTFGKADLLDEARSGANRFERQEDSQQTVRVWGDTAVVTALLWVKGRDKNETFDYTLWFSDVYVRTASGWRYVFGQATQRRPAT